MNSKKTTSLSFILIFALMISNCGAFLLSPGLRSDNQLVEVQPNRTGIQRNLYRVQAFSPGTEEDKEKVIFDSNNIWEPETDSKTLSQTTLTFLKKTDRTPKIVVVEIRSSAGIAGLNRIGSIRANSSVCDVIDWKIYRYDFVHFIDRLRRNVYPKYPEENYMREFLPRMASIEVREEPRKRIMILFDPGCSFPTATKLYLELVTEETISYEFELDGPKS
ncbi:hypothetical protein EHQ12_06495 [Leptospira gomenensis]|uniref:Uncharacterized protein n=1 Tax=Leptospira gomenensis TaxID=2484974 RepID=A0A5F1Y6I2_9LEPT|nr:hypothetical protein [Leptospira gomenensis]TGK28813.1 hypothetical protein EHQ17_17275 [Leptospira gomenensis]TGK40981.1 hypothetical protein EHQ12_06495 [Leptospira gomenensis]TGK46167.1 hypothetical protein EHQ07_06905 [Leptospira gomenensis]TGK54692.1 hypothetical protein EHQ13_18495 [Leptospira gomenensis]